LYKLKLKPHMNMFRRKLLGLESLWNSNWNLSNG
jgi:hypothetical protein